MSVAGGHAPKAAALSTELAPDAPPPPDVRPSRLIMVLLGFGAACGLTLAAAFDWTRPHIVEHETRLIESAVRDVLDSPDHFTPYYVAGNALQSEPPAGVDEDELEQVYLGYDAAGRAIGFAVVAEGPGFLETIRLIFGYDPRTGALTGMKMIDQRETPGIGDKIEKDADFVGEFRGASTPLRGVKAGRGKGDPAAVDMITGATISSRAVLAIINHKIEAVGPALRRQLEQEGAQ